VRISPKQGPKSLAPATASTVQRWSDHHSSISRSSNSQKSTGNSWVQLGSATGLGFSCSQVAGLDYESSKLTGLRRKLLKGQPDFSPSRRSWRIGSSRVVGHGFYGFRALSLNISRLSHLSVSSLCLSTLSISTLSFGEEKRKKKK
jgi:hypothetical protein